MIHGAGGLDAQLFDALPQPALACDATGCIVRCNRAARRHFADAEAGALFDIGADTASRDALHAALQQALREGRSCCSAVDLAATPTDGRRGAPPAPYRGEVCLTRLPAGPDGQAPLCLVTWSGPPRAVDGDRHGPGAEALASPGAGNDAALAASHARSHFLSRLGHEMRTPLNAVIGFTQLMRAEVEAADARPEAQLDQLDFIEQAGWQLLTMIDNMLDLARIDSGRLELHLERLSLPEALEEALSLVDAAAQRRHVRIVRHIDPALPAATADRARLRQVLLVLLDRAVKSSPDQGQVTVAAQTAEGGVRVTVGDGGPGPDPAHGQALPEAHDPPGVSADVDADASGVSLSIARQLVVAMAGRLELDHVPGQGTRYRVVLPLSDGHSGGGAA